MIKRGLVINTFSPYGSENGSTIRVMQICRSLSEFCELDLLCQQTLDVKSLKSKDPFQKKYQFPSNRLVLGFKKFVGALTGKTFAHAYRDPRVQEFIAANISNYDFILCFWLTASVNLPQQLINDQSIVKIIDLVDACSLHFLESTAFNPIRKLIHKLIFKDTLNLEAEIIQKFDRAIITTQREKNYLLNHIPSLGKCAKIEVLTNYARSFSCLDKEVPYPVIAFLGSMDYYPNVESAIKLAQDIYPKCKLTNPELKCWIVGSNPTPKVKKLEQIDGVYVTGYVENLDDVMRNIDIIVLPMSISSGIQNKLLTSMSYGKPTIINPNAVFSNGLEHLKNLAVASSTDGFVDNINLLLKDNNLREKIGIEAFQFIENDLSYSAFKEKLESIIFM